MKESKLEAEPEVECENESENESEAENKISEEFTKVICDFAEDLLITFPDIIEKTNNPIKELNRKFDDLNKNKP